MLTSTLISKLFYLLFMLLLIASVTFFAVHLAPNSFLSGGELNPNMTKESIEQLKSIYGLDKPLFTQYKEWLFNMMTLNFGISFVTGKSVVEEITNRLPITLFINSVSMVIIFAIALFFGIKAAINGGTKSDLVIKKVSLFSFSMPSFYLALLLLIFFSVELSWFPIAGLHSLQSPSGIGYYIDMLWHLVLPISVIVCVGFGSLVLYIRSLCIEILKSDYVFFAKARGLSERTLFYRYLLPNLLPPIITMLGLSMPGLIGGSVILESIFAIEGMGQLFFLSALSRDYPVIMGILIIGAFLTLLGNVIADMLLLKINPYMSK